MENIFKKIDNIKDYVTDKLAASAIIPGEYVKSARIKARPGVLGEKISTVTASGLHETDNTVTADEKTGAPAWVVTAPGGEEYIVSDSVFQSKYEPADDCGTYKPKGKPVTAGQTDEDISFTAPWGEIMNIKSGGYLIFSDMNDIYGVQKDEFESTYKKI